MEAVTVRTVTIRRANDGRSQRFRWYGPATAACVHRAVRGGLGFETAGVIYGDGRPVVLGGSAEPAAIELRDEHGGGVDLGRVRDGATLIARLRPEMRAKKDERSYPLWRVFLRDLRASLRGEDGFADGPPIPDFDRAPKHGDWNDPEFQRTLLGVERIRSHLANERNILAWTRAALTLASQGLLLWKLYAAARASDAKAWLAPYLYAVALAYFVVVPSTVVLGLHRWQATKRALNVPGGMDVQAYFGKLGVRVQAFNTFLVLVAAAAAFLVVGLDDEVFRDFKPASIFD